MAAEADMTSARFAGFKAHADAASQVDGDAPENPNQPATDSAPPPGTNTSRGTLSGQRSYRATG
jgi:hypothetical protein